MPSAEFFYLVNESIPCHRHPAAGCCFPAWSTGSPDMSLRLDPCGRALTVDGARMDEIVWRHYRPDKPVPERIFRKCGNALCLAPQHLSARSRTRLADDGRSRGPRKGDAHHRAKLTAELVVAARQKVSSGELSKAQAAAALCGLSDCSPSSANRALSGRSWRHV